MRARRRRARLDGGRVGPRAGQPDRSHHADGAGVRPLRQRERRRADDHGHRPRSRRCAQCDQRRRRDALRPHAHDRGLVPGDIGRRHGRERGVPHDLARSGACHRALRQGGPRRRRRQWRAGRGGWRVSARHHLSRVSRQSLPHESSRREPRVEGLRGRVDRSSRQHLRRPEGLRQHAVQPSVRPALRPRRTRSAVAAGLGVVPVRARRRVTHGDHRLLDGWLRTAQRAGSRIQRRESSRHRPRR